MLYKKESVNLNAQNPLFSDLDTENKILLRLESEQNQYVNIDSNILENIFESIKISYYNNQNIDIIACYDQLSQIYLQGPTNTAQFALKYEFLDICSDIIVKCPDVIFLQHILHCIYNGIHADKNLLNLFANPLFSEQLIFCIDEKGSAIYAIGFDILSKTIQGYSHELFKKIIYIFNSTKFNQELTDIDIEKLIAFGKVFEQISKFTNSFSYPIMLILAKSLLLYGAINYSSNILNNIVDHHDDAYERIFISRQLTKEQFLEIGEENQYYFEDFKPVDDDANPVIRKPIFRYLLLSITRIKDFSFIFHFDFESALVSTLSVINKLSKQHIWYYRSAFKPLKQNIEIIEYLSELMDYDENQSIQSQACSLVSNICLSEDYVLVVNQKTMETFLRRINKSPLNVRESCLNGILNATEHFTPSQIADLVNWKVLELMLDFYLSDSVEIHGDIAYSFWVMFSNSKEARSKGLDFLDDFETMLHETQDERVWSRLYLIINILKQESPWASC